MNGASAFFKPGGTLEPEAESYIERAADRQLFEALVRGEYVYLLDSRQKGKSSMVARTILRLKEAGVDCAKLDLQRYGANVTPSQWYASLLAGLGSELGLASEMFAYWEATADQGPLARWVGAIESVVLAEPRRPLVVFIDEIDFVRALPFSSAEFFAGIRDSYNRRADDERFRRLTFCLVGVATPGQLIVNPEITPFNVGVRVAISDFSEQETQAYSPVLNSGRNGSALLSRVHHWLNGHPYLTQLLCSHIARSPEIRTPADVDQLVHRLLLTSETHHREPNLADVERQLLNPDVPGLESDEKRTRVLELYGLVLKGERVEANTENPFVATFLLSGIGAEKGGLLVVRNRLYRAIFDERWRRQSLPDAEARRVRRAVTLAVTRTAVTAGIVLAAVSGLAFGMWRLSAQKQRALNDLALGAKRLESVSEARKDLVSQLEQSNKELRKISQDRLAALNEVQEKNTQLERLSREKARALSDLVKQSGELSFQRYASNAFETRVMMAANRWRRVRDLLAEAANNPNRGWEWGHLALKTGYGERYEKFPRFSVFEDQPDGSLGVVSPTSVYVTANQPARVVQALSQDRPFVPRYRVGRFRVVQTNRGRGGSIRDAQTGKVLIQLPKYSTVFDVDPARGRYLAGEDESLETVQLRSIPDGRLIRAFQGPGQTDAARFLGDGSILSAHASEKDEVEELRRWNADGQTISSATSDQHYANGLALSPDRSRFVLWGTSGRAQICTTDGLKVENPVAPHPERISTLAFSRDGKRILTGGEDGVMRLIDALTGKILRAFPGHDEPVSSVAFLPNQAGWVSLDKSGNARFWSAQSTPDLNEFHQHSQAATKAYITANGRYLVSTGREGTIASLDLATGRTVKVGGGAYISRGEDANEIYQGRPDGSIVVRDPTDLRILRQRKLFDKPFLYLSLLAKGTRLVARGPGRAVLLLDAKSLQTIARFEPAPTRKAVTANGVTIQDATAFDQEGKRLAFFMGDVGLIQVYSMIDGRLLKEWDPGQVVLRMVFMNAGQDLVACMGEAVWVDDGYSVVFDATTGNRRQEINVGGPTLAWLDYAPKAHVLGAMDSKGIVYRWDARTLEPLPGLQGTLRADIFFFSPDGKRVVTSSSDGAVRFYETFTGTERLALSAGIPAGPSGSWGAAARFSADGRRVLLLSPDGWVRVWNSRT